MGQVRGGQGGLERVLKNKVVCGPEPFGRGSRGEGRGRGRSALCVMAASGRSRDLYYTWLQAHCILQTVLYSLHCI